MRTKRRRVCEAVKRALESRETDGLFAKLLSVYKISNPFETDDSKLKASKIEKDLDRGIARVSQPAEVAEAVSSTLQRRGWIFEDEDDLVENIHRRVLEEFISSTAQRVSSLVEELAAQTEASDSDEDESEEQESGESEESESEDSGLASEDSDESESEESVASHSNKRARAE